MPDLYDVIGRTYASRRQTDPRLAAAINAAIGDAASVLNVGAGTGSYEPVGPRVVAVEPSAVMLAQRPSTAAPAVKAHAEALPFADRSFDVVLGVITVQHWTDQRLGLEECVRVARARVVIFTWDPESDGFWLMREYFPEIQAVDRRRFPTLDMFADILGNIAVRIVPIPADCADGFVGAFWRRPEAYLDGDVRSGMSSLARVSPSDTRLERLRADLASGAWAERHRDLLSLDSVDIGYRLIVADRPR
jgi:SAM-dependent methyltransferase